MIVGLIFSSMYWSIFLTFDLFVCLSICLTLKLSIFLSPLYFLLVSHSAMYCRGVSVGLHVHVHHDLGMIIHSKEGLLPWLYLLTSHIYSLSVLMSLMHGSCGQLELASSRFASCKVKSSCMLAERRGEWRTLRSALHAGRAHACREGVEVNTHSRVKQGKDYGIRKRYM